MIMVEKCKVLWNDLKSNTSIKQPYVAMRIELLMKTNTWLQVLDLSNFSGNIS